MTVVIRRVVMNLGLLLLRVVVGGTLAAHGAQKLFGWFGGPGLSAAGQGFEHLGFTPGRRYAALAGVGETGAGVLLALGLLTPAAAAIVFAVMLVAAWTAHRGAGFFAAQGGYEYNVVLAATAISLAFSGPGSWSLDALLQLPLAGNAWGSLAVIAGVIGAIVPLAGRRRFDAHEARAAA
jgi:putative oxidoreductase